MRDAGKDVNLPPTKDEVRQIGRALEGLAKTGLGIGLDGVGPSALSACAPIRFYEAVDGKLREIGDRYPIVNESSEVVFLAYDAGGELPVVTTALVSQINEELAPDEKFAVVYDYDGCYFAREDGSLCRVASSSYAVPGRDSLVGVTFFAADEIALSSIGSPVSLDVALAPGSRVLRARLNVGFVTQNPPSNICWAACVASVANYRDQGARDARGVAEGYLGADYDHTITEDQFLAVLERNGVDGYAAFDTWPVDAVVDGDLTNGFPPIGIMEVGGRTDVFHAVVVCECDAPSSIVVMDPEFGMTTAARTGAGYSYSSGFSGAALTTVGSIRHA